jgi:oligopeptide/dipeptide ABC transporter ATP-binding protein
MVFQDPLRALNPVLTVGYQLRESLKKTAGLPRKAARARAIELLERVRIDNPELRLRQYPHQLSGGMRQRVLIAIAVAASPELILADEPTTALDASVQQTVLDLLAEVVRELNASVILITHDIAVAASIADRVAVMYAGRVVETGSISEIVRNPRVPYTKALLDAALALEDGRQGVLPTIPENPMAMYEEPAGCAFASRCDRAVDVCWNTDPVLVADNGRSWACHDPYGEDVSVG